MKNSKKGQKDNVFSFMKKAFLEGDLKTRLSFLIMGYGNILHKQIVKGILFLAIEIAFLIFMVQYGAGAIGDLWTLGETQQGWVYKMCIRDRRRCAFLSISEYSSGFSCL